ncbi:MAG TPA: filamentous hemagglutinin N-terminal domain-containing protein, partial [Gammaproteobacteria bacterium]
MSKRMPAGNSIGAIMQLLWSQARLRRGVAQAAGALGALVPAVVFANPTGGQVVAGSASIGSAGANGVVVNQNSQRAAINWQQFSIGSNEYVQFVQPNSSSVVLNRVIGNNPSSIFGEIKANGQVFLINPNGILFAPGSTLDVSSLTASTLDISDADFMAGRYVFSKAAGAPDATVVNQGSVTVTQGGYVVLAGDYVENDGVINAVSGKVLLAAGGGATLTLDNNGGLIGYKVDAPTLARLAGVDNTGSIVADGGSVVMTADVANALTATAVNNSGFITAHSVSQRGGEILLLAQGGGIENSGTLDASATQAGVAGGTVILHGKDDLKLAASSKIETEGDGAKGGFVDLSGHGLAIRGGLDVGRGGELLLDPSSLEIIPGTNSCESCEAGHPKVGVGFIQNQLNAGVNVSLVASHSIFNSAAVTSLKAVTGAGKLSIRIGHTSNASFNSGSLNDTFACESGGVCVTGTNEKLIQTTGGTISLSGMSITIKGAFVAVAEKGTVNLRDVTADGGISIRASHIHLAGNLSAPGASIAISGSGGTPSGLQLSAAAGKTMSAKNVSIDLESSYGGSIAVGAINATSRASIRLFDDSGGHHPDVIKVGAISAPKIYIYEEGKQATITTGALTASTANNEASVTIQQDVINNGTGQITVNGAITVSGKTNGYLGSFNLPEAAVLKVESTGTSDGARSIKLNGAINVTAVGAAYHASSGNESGPRMGQTGTGGVASVLILANGSHGAASVTGDLTATGPDAFAVVQAHSVSMKNISLDATGHTITRTLTEGSAGQSFHSHNTAGQATLILGNAGIASGSGATATIKVGNITVSGRGVAQADLYGAQVSAGSVNVTATAAKGSIHEHGSVFGCFHTPCINQNSSDLWRGINGVQLATGSMSAGRAGIAISSQQGNGPGVPATSIKTGALSVSGVGEASINLSGKTVQTGGLTAIATKGTEHGVGSSVSGANNSHTFAHTFKLDGGSANIRITSGNSGSNGSGLLTQNGGPVTITGNITATGPTANVNLKSQSVTVAGNVTVTGSGGALTSDTVFTSPSSPGYHVHYVGPGQITGLNVQGGANGLVSIGGNVDVKGPGLVGVIIIGTTVKLHGLSASASAAENYSVLDTRVSNTTTTFTDDSLAVIVDAVGGTKTAPAFTAATVTGNVDLGAKGDVHLATRIDVSGSLVVHAGGNILGSAGSVISRFNLVGNGQPHPFNNDSGGGPSNAAAGFLPTLQAQANAIGMTAGGNIILSKSQLTIGTGSVSSKILASDTGDAALLAGLGAAGLAPASTAPNGFFKAGGSLELGSVVMNGSYLYLQAADISVVGKVAAPTGALVQIVPGTVTGTIDVEGTGAAGATLNINDNGLFNVFPDGITLVLGGAGQSGDITLGGRGPF